MTAKVKICGITNIEDATLAENLGADFIGLIFAKKSPRYVSPEQAKKIVSALSSAKAVGVFVEQDHQETENTAENCGLWGIQHYSYFDTPFQNHAYIYAIRMGAPDAPKDFTFQNYDYLLIDSYDEKIHGGTGKTFDWSKIPLDRDRVFLAGGLGPENICAAARENVFSLDLSSSVEAHPGKKDPEKLKSLFDNLKNA